MLKRSFFMLVFVLSCQIFQLAAQSGNSAGLSDPESNFPQNDPLRAIVEPIRLGTNHVQEKMDAIKAQGREPIGLILAGGSARAYSHIGVLKVLEEHGIFPDFIVANSMGAVIGMLYAAGLSPSTIAELVGELSPESYLNIVLPTRGGLLNADPFVAVIKKIVGDIDLSDTQIPIIVTAEDLITRRQVQIAEGDFSRVMATTFAIPAIFEPVAFGSFLLVDGGVTNIVPIDIALEYSDTLIISTALYDKDMSFDNPISVINRAFDIGKTRAGMKGIMKVKPFIIRNRVEEISYMQFSTPSFIIELGSSSANAVVRDIVAGLPSASLRDGPGEELQKLRKQYSESVQKAILSFKAGALPAVSPSLRFKLDYKLADPFEYTALSLDSQGYLGFSVVGSIGRIKGSVGSLAGLSGNDGREWNLNAKLSFNPFDTIIASAEARLWGDLHSWPENIIDIDSLELLGMMSWTSKGGAVVVRPMLAGVLDICLDNDTSTWETHGLIDAETFFTRSARVFSQQKFPAFLSGRIGMFAEGGSDMAALRYGPEATVKLGVARKDFLALRGRVSGRLDLVSAGTMLKRADAFRGPLVPGSAAFVAVANAELVWLARILEFDAGEIVIIKNIEVGPYFDCVWFDTCLSFAEISTFSTGLSLSLTASFAGLSPFDISCFAGISSTMVPVFGLRSTRLFPAFK
jgi:NTE family protein